MSRGFVHLAKSRRTRSTVISLSVRLPYVGPVAFAITYCRKLPYRYGKRVRMGASE